MARKRPELVEITLDALLAVAPNDKHRAAITAYANNIIRQTGYDAVRVSFDGDAFVISSAKEDEQGLPAASIAGGFSDDPKGDKAEAAVVTFDYIVDKQKAIAEGRADAAAGRVISHDRMCAWLDSWGTENELPPPSVQAEREPPVLCPHCGPSGYTGNENCDLCHGNDYISPEAHEEWYRQQSGFPDNKR